MKSPHYQVLQTIIAEFKTLSPEITRTIIFDNTSTLCSENISSKQCEKLVEQIKNLTEQTQPLGGIERFTLQGAANRLNLSTINNKHIVITTKRDANEKIVRSLTTVLLPSIIQLIDAKPQTDTVSLGHDQIQETIPFPSNDAEPDISTTESDLEPEPEFSEPVVVRSPVSQFLVEKLGGLLVAPDTVRVNSDTITEWNQLLWGKSITHVTIETLEGKTVTCKIKPQKEFSAKGIIQIPEKILNSLQIRKGELVMVRPVLEE
ncbi:MAG: hypothetical protein NWE92_03135 [Candidatus Bathyarchaeota archaeon]|nr:hypothetical protein [Candidatus Bathyarchaeota archaeon]